MTTKRFLSNLNSVRKAEIAAVIALAWWLIGGAAMATLLFPVLHLKAALWSLPFAVLWSIGGTAASLLHITKRGALTGLLCLILCLWIGSVVVFIAGFSSPDPKLEDWMLLWLAPFICIWSVGMIATSLLHWRMMRSNFKRLGFLCPHCHVNLLHTKALVIASKHCGRCGVRVLDDDGLAAETASQGFRHWRTQSEPPSAFVMVVARYLPLETPGRLCFAVGLLLLLCCLPGTVYGVRTFVLNPHAARPWIDKGARLSAAGRHAEALACYDRALAIDPHNADLWGVRGWELYELRRYDEANASYDHALTLDPKYYWWGGKSEAQYAGRRYADALDSLNHVLASKPHDAYYLNCKGWSLIYLGRYAEALDVYNRALGSAPNNADLWEGKAATLCRLGRHEEMLVCYERALKINPRSARYWYGKGLALGKMGKHPEALAALDHAISLNSHDDYSWSLKGWSLSKMGRDTEALACYDRALALNSHNFRYWYWKSKALDKIGQPAKGLDYCDHALALVPCNSYLWAFEAALLYKLHRYDEMRTCYDRAFAAKPRTDKYWFDKGNLRDVLVQHQDALAYYDYLVAANPARDKSTSDSSKPLPPCATGCT